MLKGTIDQMKNQVRILEEDKAQLTMRLKDKEKVGDVYYHKNLLSHRKSVLFKLILIYS